MNKKPITESMFKAVKTLIAGGASYKECADYMQIGYSTVSRIGSVETFEEYRQVIAAINAKIKQKKAEPEQEVKPEVKEEAKPVNGTSIYQTNRLIQLMNEQNELLKSISNKIAFIVEQLA